MGILKKAKGNVSAFSAIRQLSKEDSEADRFLDAWRSFPWQSTWRAVGEFRAFVEANPLGISPDEARELIQRCVAQEGSDLARAAKTESWYAAARRLNEHFRELSKKLSGASSPAMQEFGRYHSELEEAVAFVKSEGREALEGQGNERKKLLWQQLGAMWALEGRTDMEERGRMLGPTSEKDPRGRLFVFFKKHPNGIGPLDSGRLVSQVTATGAGFLDDASIARRNEYRDAIRSLNDRLVFFSNQLGIPQPKQDTNAPKPGQRQASLVAEALGDYAKFLYRQCESGTDAIGLLDCGAQKGNAKRAAERALGLAEKIGDERLTAGLAALFDAHSKSGYLITLGEANSMLGGFFRKNGLFFELRADSAKDRLVTSIALGEIKESRKAEYEGIEYDVLYVERRPEHARSAATVIGETPRGGFASHLFFDQEERALSGRTMVIFVEGSDNPQWRQAAYEHELRHMQDLIAAFNGGKNFGSGDLEARAFLSELYFAGPKYGMGMLLDTLQAPNLRPEHKAGIEIVFNAFGDYFRTEKHWNFREVGVSILREIRSLPEEEIRAAAAHAFQSLYGEDINATRRRVKESD